MKLLQSVIVAAVSANKPLSPAETALQNGCEEGPIPNAFKNDQCISDDDCNNKENHRIFNHFYFLKDTEPKFILVPECREIDAELTPGFSCGTDTRLEEGSEVVIRNVPETNFKSDQRSVKLLRREKFDLLEAALKSHCEETSDDPTCNEINHFEDGCTSKLDQSSKSRQFFYCYKILSYRPKNNVR